MKREGNDAQILEVKFYCSELGGSPCTVVPLAPGEEPSPGKDVEPKEDDLGYCGWEGGRGGPAHLALTEGPTPIRPAIAFNLSCISGGISIGGMLGSNRAPSVIFSSDELPDGAGTMVEPIKGAGARKYWRPVLDVVVGGGGEHSPSGAAKA
ncbi:hypothetical protein RhiXN_11531 [Rhizoctonia solani]|uniref:Uncharacterized protein n=1 Tax=Rhizoctonia solani TaxID=456999 RepID=A0A8H8P341_9AGAM|nr:uncharacterized protein RhiXN_11531 [Rhizoctonia solani]QRW24619.1 hypothetical protein RhiXN_11531 [Rhizoctonia solani]